MMKKCLFFVNDLKSEAQSAFEIAKNVLGKHGCKYELYDGKFLNECEIDFAIVIGGDGTFLQAAGVCCRYDIPIVGINLGRMGFLTSIDPCDIEKHLELILNGQNLFEYRMMTELIDIDGNIYGSALNDIVFKNSFGHGVGIFRVYVNDSFMAEYNADGVLISTPTGSTAYSLSVGGPIVNPSCELMIVSPISSHSLNSRSVIVNSTDLIKVEFDADSTFIGIDGKGIDTSENAFLIRKSNYKCKFIKFTEDNFYKNVFEKIK